MMTERSDIYRLLPEIPREQLFIETDDSDYAIEEIYRAVANRRGEDIEEVKQYVFDNFCNVFCNRNNTRK